MGQETSPFGGKIIILAGDYRQCLPVIPRATRQEIVKSCINKSDLFVNFKVFQLTENMRVKASGDPNLEAFDKWTVSIGDGISNDTNGLTSIPQHMFYNIKPNTATNSKQEEDCMRELCTIIFPDLDINIQNPKWLDGRTILAPTNREVDALNDIMQNWVPGTAIILTSTDSLEYYRDVMHFKC